MHFTDTHGGNQVNFFLLFCDNYQFAPRYRDLHKKMASLVGFQHPNHYVHYLIKPARKTFDALIVKEWPNIQRIVASLAQKGVTQAAVVRKLSYYARTEADQAHLVQAGSHRDAQLLDAARRRCGPTFCTEGRMFKVS